MKYYIDKVSTWSPANRKCQEVQSFVVEYRQTLIPDDDAVEAMMKEIREKVEELNDRYPRTKRLMVRKDGEFVFCISEERKLDEQYVFTFYIRKVKQNDGIITMRPIDDVDVVSVLQTRSAFRGFVSALTDLLNYTMLDAYEVDRGEGGEI